MPGGLIRQPALVAALLLLLVRPVPSLVPFALLQLLLVLPLVVHLHPLVVVVVVAALATAGAPRPLEQERAAGGMAGFGALALGPLLGPLAQDASRNTHEASPTCALVWPAEGGGREMRTRAACLPGPPDATSKSPFDR